MNSASTLNFGTQGGPTLVPLQTSTIQVQCTNATPYNIGLNAGTGTGATVNTRKMSSGGGAVRYGDGARRRDRSRGGGVDVLANTAVDTIATVAVVCSGRAPLNRLTRSCVS